MVYFDGNGNCLSYNFDAKENCYKPYSGGYYSLEGSTLHMWSEGIFDIFGTFDGYSIEANGLKYTKK